MHMVTKHLPDSWTTVGIRGRTSWMFHLCLSCGDESKTLLWKMLPMTISLSLTETPTPSWAVETVTERWPEGEEDEGRGKRRGKDEKLSSVCFMPDTMGGFNLSAETTGGSRQSSTRSGSLSSWHKARPLTGCGSKNPTLIRYLMCLMKHLSSEMQEKHGQDRCSFFAPVCLAPPYFYLNVVKPTQEICY